MKTVLRAALPLLLSVAWLLPGCGEETASDPGPNDVSIYWVVSGGRCVDVGIYNVDVEIVDSDGVLYEQGSFQ